MAAMAMAPAPEPEEKKAEKRSRQQSMAQSGVTLSSSRKRDIFDALAANAVNRVRMPEPRIDIETFPAAPEVGMDIETFPASPERGLDIETFPAPQRERGLHIETFPGPEMLAEQLERIRGLYGGRGNAPDYLNDRFMQQMEESLWLQQAEIEREKRKGLGPWSKGGPEIKFFGVTDPTTGAYIGDVHVRPGESLEEALAEIHEIAAELKAKARGQQSWQAPEQAQGRSAGRAYYALAGEYDGGMAIGSAAEPEVAMAEAELRSQILDIDMRLFTGEDPEDVHGPGSAVRNGMSSRPFRTTIGVERNQIADTLRIHREMRGGEAYIKLEVDLDGVAAVEESARFGKGDSRRIMLDRSKIPDSERFVSIPAIPEAEFLKRVHVVERSFSQIMSTTMTAGRNRNYTQPDKPARLSLKSVYSNTHKGAPGITMRSVQANFADIAADTAILNANPHRLGLMSPQIPDKRSFADVSKFFYETQMKFLGKAVHEGIPQMTDPDTGKILAPAVPPLKEFGVHFVTVNGATVLAAAGDKKTMSHGDPKALADALRDTSRAFNATWHREFDAYLKDHPKTSFSMRVAGHNTSMGIVPVTEPGYIINGGRYDGMPMTVLHCDTLAINAPVAHNVDTNYRLTNHQFLQARNPETGFVETYNIRGCPDAKPENVYTRSVLEVVSDIHRYGSKEDIAPEDRKSVRQHQIDDIARAISGINPPPPPGDGPEAELEIGPAPSHDDDFAPFPRPIRCVSDRDPRPYRPIPPAGDLDDEPVRRTIPREDPRPRRPLPPGFDEPEPEPDNDDDFEFDL